MENYKITGYNSKTLSATEIETKIPASIVSKVKQVLEEPDKYFTTPVMINPEDNSVVLGVIDMSDRTLVYKITISPNP